MATINVNGDDIEVIYTDDAQLAVYPDDDLEADGFVAQEQARYTAQPVPGDIVKRHFWWYRFLLLNKEYAECCKSKGQGSQHAAFYADWGDIFALPFPSWWQQYGRRIAGLEDWVVKDVTDDPNLENYRPRSSHLLLAINLDTPGNRKAIYEAVTNLIRRKLDEHTKSATRHRAYVAEQCNYELLKWAYEVYIGNKATELDDKEPERAETARLVGLPATQADLEVEDDIQKGRKEGDLRKAATEIIANALEMGRFPIHGRRKASQINS